MPRYTIKKGYENRVFSEQGIVRVSESEIDSDHELFSPYLEAVDVSPTVAEPIVTATPVQPVQATTVATPVTPQQTVNQESENQ